MECYSRYAIYFAPEQGSDLANFGASWLGWDAQSGQNAAHPIFDDLPVPVSELTATPRKYGFHGTLMAPFRLAYNKSVVDLNQAVAELAYRQFPFEIERIGLRSIGGFLAITPEERNADLVALAGACVRELDKFRAPLSNADLLRRRSANLTGPQDRYLTRWGYPYVFDEFQFHMTLSGKLVPDVIGPVQNRLQQALAKPLAQPLPVREICLFREDEDGRFYILKRYALNALAAARPESRPKILSETHHFG